MFLQQLFTNTGIYGILVGIASLVSLFAGVIISLLTRRRKYAWVILRLALLPPLVGLFGAYRGYREMEVTLTAIAAADPDHAPEEEVELRAAGMRCVWETACFGIAASIPTIAVGAIALRRSHRGDATQALPLA